MRTTTRSGAGWHQTPLDGHGSQKQIARNESYHSGTGSSKAGTGSAQGIAAVVYHHGAKRFIVGKLLRIDGEVVFYSKVRQADVLQALDAFSLLPEALGLLDAWGGRHIHYWADWENLLYVIDVDTVRSKGLLRSMNAAIGRRYHVPRKHWRKTALSYRVPYVEEEVVIEAEPEAVQLGLELRGVLP